MGTTANEESAALPPRPRRPLKFRLNFFASFLFFFAGCAAVLVIVQIVSMLTSNDPILTPFILLFPFILGTYGVAVSLVFGFISRLMWAYELTDEAFILAHVIGKDQHMPWDSITKVEPVITVRGRRLLFRIHSEAMKNDIHFLNWITKRKKFDQHLLDFTQESNPMRQLLRPRKQLPVTNDAT